MRESIVVLALLAMTAMFRPASGAEGSPQQPKTLDGSAPVKLNYLLYLPADYEKQSSWPLVLFLHGAGERGDDLELVKTHGPPKLVEKGKSFPFVLVSPQCPKTGWWPLKTTELTALLDDVQKQYKIDPDRVYCTGISMGGFGTWSLTLAQPDRFAAIVPVCGGGEALLARMIAKVPVWAFHGAKDFIVPLKRSEDMVDALKRNQAEVKLTIYPEAGHDSWTATYDNPEVYDWLLQHKRKPVTADKTAEKP